VLENHLQGGACESCGTKIPGVWEKSSKIRPSDIRKVTHNYEHINL
jgi:hypothetical protein